MKKILITGAYSYIGMAFERYMAQWQDEYQVDTEDMVDGNWRKKNFTGYDTVFHVAGIAHQDSGKITEERKKLYFSVNADLTIETAKKAKAEGVGHFIFMSSIIVYGLCANLGQTKVITKDTIPSPVSAYGMSKLKAEEGILQIADDTFHVCILRPPMIYGPGCKGNYPKLAKAALTLPFFPEIKNERSMLFIENLCIFLKAVVVSNLAGIHFPQNAEYVCTSDMVVKIAQAHGKNIHLIKTFNPILRLLSGKVGVVDKLFGGLVYDQSLTGAANSDEGFSFEESISISEKGLSA